MRIKINKKLSNSHFLNKYIKIGILNKTRIYLNKIFISVIWKELLNNFLYKKYYNNILKNIEFKLHNSRNIKELRNNIFINNIISFEKKLNFFFLISKIFFNKKIENNNINLFYNKYDLYMINILKAIFIKKLIKNLLLRSLISKLYLNNFKYNIINLTNKKKLWVIYTINK